MRFWSTTRHWGAIIIQIINANRLTCLLFTLPPLLEHGGDQSDRCGAWWHCSDSRVLSPGSRGSSWGFTWACAVPVSSGRKLMLAGNQVWWKLSPTSSAPPPHPVPPTACVRSCFMALWGFPAAWLTCTKKVSDPVRAGVPWHSQSFAEQGNLCIPFNGTRQWFAELGAKQSKEGEAQKPNPEFSFVPRMQFGFYLDSSPSLLNWPCVWGVTILSFPHLLCCLCARTNISEPFQGTRWVKWSACKVPK